MLVRLTCNKEDLFMYNKKSLSQKLDIQSLYDRYYFSPVGVLCGKESMSQKPVW